MPRVLIPFAEPEGAQRAVAPLLRESREAGLSVHLLAAVEPRVAGREGIDLSAPEVERMVRAAAARWFVPLTDARDPAGVARTTETVAGPMRTVLRAAAARADIGRVRLPPPGLRIFARREGHRIRERSPHPVTLVA